MCTAAKAQKPGKRKTLSTKTTNISFCTPGEKTANNALNVPHFHLKAYLYISRELQKENMEKADTFVFTLNIVDTLKQHVLGQCSTTTPCVVKILHVVN